MNAERWQKIKSLLERVSDLNPDERSTVLDTACEGDAELRAEVEKLLHAQNEAEDFLESPAAAMFAQEDVLIGKHIGPYRIERLLGQGGMGKVYAAVRDDREFRKQVALKLVKRGMDTDDVLKRFRNERQTLAGLNHPNISALLDGGSTDDGLPYFVMEYIDGIPIDQYCDSQRLSTSQRLKLFRKVCAAVHYAHQNLVVHRDLKPGNILITPQGEPKLLDFGIAKLLNAEVAGQTIDLTRSGVRFMSPEYASPEQIRGGAITTASDIYTLGVLLYKLLTGHRPYHIQGRPPQEIEQVICEEQPTKPSAIVTTVRETTSTDGTPTKLTPEAVSKTREDNPGKLRRRLAGDLDNIILMAMRKEPEHRYSSIAQFSEDILRHLEGLPVIAQRSTFRYQASKFIARHKKAVVLSALFVILLLASIVGITWQANVAATQRDKARLEAKKSKEVVAFLQEMLSAVDPAKSGKDVTVSEVLAEAAKRVERELTGQPEIEAQVRTTIGLTYQALGLYDAAEPHLRKALAIRTRIHGRNHLDTAVSLRHLAVLLRKTGEFEDARRLYTDAIVTHRNLKTEATIKYAQTLNDYAVFLDEQEEYRKAEQVLREALSLEKRLLGKRHEEISTVLNNLGHVYFNRGELDSAETMYRKALSIAKENEDLTEAQILMNNLAGIFMRQQDYQGAEKFLRESLDIQRQLYGNDYPLIGTLLQNLAANNFYQGDYDDAEALIRQSIEHSQRVLTSGHPDIATSLWWLARILIERGQFREAERVTRKALELTRNAFSESHWTITYAKLTLGRALFAQERYSKAEPILRKCYPKLLETPGDNTSAIKRALQALVDLYEKRHQPEEAEDCRNLLLDYQG